MRGKSASSYSRIGTSSSLLPLPSKAHRRNLLCLEISMASYHHRHHHNPQHHHPPPQPPTYPNSYCCCADHNPNSCCNPSHQPTLPPTPLDPPVDCLIARLLQSSPPPSPAHGPHLQRRYLNSHHQQQHSILLSSLLYRIESLESSLHSLSFSSSPLRDAAARVIQTHFRSFLARRSRTLGHLKDLAAIKSSLLVLKSSVSNMRSAHLNLVTVSEKAMDLLLRLDAIQNHDPMIRDGKRSISRDLDAFLEYVDQLAVKRRELLVVNSRKTVKVAANRNNKSKILREQKELVDKLKDRVERIRGLSRVLGTEEDVELEGFQNFSDDGEENDRRLIHRIDPATGTRAPRVKKTVTFEENGNVYRVISSDPDHSWSGDGGTESGDDLVKVSAEDGKPKGSYVIVKDYEEADMDNSSSSPMSSDGPDLRGSQARDESKFVFSAPVPERMESREDLAKKRKGAALKIKP